MPIFRKLHKLSALLLLALFVVQSLAPVSYAADGVDTNVNIAGTAPASNDSATALGTAADSLMNYYINYSLQNGPEWLQRTRLSGSLFSGGATQFDFSTIQPFSGQAYRDLGKMLFWQGSYNFSSGGGDSTSTLNGGVGYRSMFAKNSGMAGLNLFYDWQLAPRSHQRLSVGAEIYKNSLEGHFNYYQGISGAMLVGSDPLRPGYNLYEQAANGFDISLGTNFAFWEAPWLKLSATGYNYLAQNGGSINGQNGSYGGLTLNLDWQATPQLQLSAGTDVVNNSAYARFSYNLLAPPTPAAFGGDRVINANAARDLSYRMFDPVIRNNQIVVEQYSRAVNYGPASVIVSIVRPDGTPVHNGAVQIKALNAPVGVVAEQNSVTNNAGKVVFRVPVGMNTISLPGTAVSQTLTASAGSNNEIELIADIAGSGKVTIKVRDKDGNPVENRKVKLTDDSGYSYENTTDNQGNAEFEVQAGNYTVEDEVSGSVFNISVVSGETAYITLYNRDMALLNVTALQKNGNPATGVQISAFDTDAGKLRARSTTDSSGHATLELLENSFDLKLSNSNIISAVAVKAKETKSITIQAKDAAIADITLQKSDGSAWSNQPLQAVQDGAVVATAYSNSSGVAHFELNAGKYVFQTDSGFQSAPQTLNSDVITTATLKAGITTVTLSDIANEPDKGAGIDILALSDSGTQVASKPTDGNGVAQFALAAGKYKFAIANDDVYSNTVAVGSANIDVALNAKAVIRIVVSAAGQDNLAGRWINLYRDGKYYGAYQIDNKGLADIAVLKGHKYHVALASSNLDADFAPQGSGVTSVKLAGSTVKTMLLDAKGNKLANTKVIASQNGVDMAWEKSDANGVANFVIAAGNYVFAVDGMNVKSEVVSVANNENRELTLVDKVDAVAVTVQLQHADGKPWPKKWLSAALNGTLITEKYSDINGVAQFSLQPDTYSFFNNMGISKTISVTAGMDTVVLQGADILLTVQNADASPADKIEAQLYTSDNKFISRELTSNGQVGFSVPTGNYKILLTGTSLGAENISAEAGRTSMVNITKPAEMSAVTVAAVKADDSAWSGIWITARKSGQEVAQLQTGADGKVIFHLSAGNYTFATVSNVSSKPYIMDGKSPGQIEIVSGDVLVSVLNATGTAWRSSKITAVDVASGREVAWSDQINDKAYFGLADGSYRFKISDSNYQSDVVNVVAGKIRTTTIDANPVTKADVTIALVDANGLALTEVNGLFSSFKIDGTEWPAAQLALNADKVTFKNVNAGSHQYRVEYSQKGITDRTATASATISNTDVQPKMVFAAARTMQLQAWDAERATMLADSFAITVDGKITGSAEQKTGVARFTGLIDGVHVLAVNILPKGFESCGLPANNVLSAANNIWQLSFAHGIKTVTLTAQQSDKKTVLSAVNGRVLDALVDGVIWPNTDTVIQGGVVTLKNVLKVPHSFALQYLQNGQRIMTVTSNAVQLTDAESAGAVDFPQLRNVSIAVKDADTGTLMTEPVQITLDGDLKILVTGSATLADIADGQHALSLGNLPSNYASYLATGLTTDGGNDSIVVSLIAIKKVDVAIAMTDANGNALTAANGKYANFKVDGVLWPVADVLVANNVVKFKKVPAGVHNYNVEYWQDGITDHHDQVNITARDTDNSITAAFRAVRTMQIQAWDSSRSVGIQAQYQVRVDARTAMDVADSKTGIATLPGMLDGAHVLTASSLPSEFETYTQPLNNVLSVSNAVLQLPLVRKLKTVVLTAQQSDKKTALAGANGTLSGVLVDGQLWPNNNVSVRGGVVTVKGVTVDQHSFVLQYLQKGLSATVSSNSTTLASAVLTATVDFPQVRNVDIQVINHASGGKVDTVSTVVLDGAISAAVTGSATLNDIVDTTHTLSATLPKGFASYSIANLRTANDSTLLTVQVEPQVLHEVVLHAKDANGITIDGMDGGLLSSPRLDGENWFNWSAEGANGFRLSKVPTGSHDYELYYVNGSGEHTYSAITRGDGTSLQVNFANVRNISVVFQDAKGQAIKNVMCSVNLDYEKNSSMKKSGVVSGNGYDNNIKYTAIIDGAHTFTMTTLPAGYTKYALPANLVTSASNNKIVITLS